MDLIYRFDLDRTLVEDAAPSDAAAAIRRLEEGSQRSCEIATAVREGSEAQIVVDCTAGTLGLESTGVAQSQHPFAVIVGCSDARVPTEHVFQQAANDLFVVRVAGGVLGDEGLGSVDYAVEHFGESLKLVVVLGHTGCGAVTAAVDLYLRPRRFGEIGFTRSLRSMVYRLLLPVRAGAKALSTCAGSVDTDSSEYRRALIEVSVWLNAAEAAFQLRRDIAKRGKHQVDVVYGVYDIERHRVAVPWPTPAGDALEGGLLPAPQGQEDFETLFERLQSSRLLQGFRAGG
jgi:carbonic anhydrase